MNDVPFLKELFATLALILTFALMIPYLILIWQGRIRPHVFSWFIWGTGTVIVFVAQISDGAGIGAWPIGISGMLTFCVAFTALIKSSDTTIVKADWVFLILAMSALPLWYLTSTALSAVIVLTIVDLLGFGPSIRKAIELPYEENATFFALGMVRNAFVLIALENYSWTTMLFPAAVGCACLIFSLLIIARRWQLTVNPPT